MSTRERSISASEDEEERSKSSSDSTCSSCSLYSDASIPEWDSSVQENGELCFMKCSPITQDIRPNVDKSKSTVMRSKSNKFSTFLRKPKLKKKKSAKKVSKHDDFSSLSKVNTDSQDVANNNFDNHSHHSIAVSFLNVASMENGESDTYYYFPQPGDKNIIYLTRGALLTLYHLLPKLISEKVESCTMYIEEEPVHLIFVGEQKGLMILICPKSRSSLFQLKQLGTSIKHYLNFKYKSLFEAFSNHNHHTGLDQFFGNLFIKLSSNKFCSLERETRNSLLKEQEITNRLEKAFIYPRSLPISPDLMSKIHEKLNELEANDFGDLSEDHYGCQRLFLIIGTCLYFKGYLVVNHLHRDDLIDVHAYLRLNDILDLTVTSVMESLIVWQEVYLSSYNREAPHAGLSSRKRWFLLIVGKDHSILVALLESGGCSVSSTEVLRPDELYVEQVQDTLNDILHLGLSYEVRRRMKSLPSNSGKSMRRSSCRSADSSTLNLSQVSNGVGEESFSESVSRTTSSAISDDVLPVLGRRAQRLQQLSNSGSVYTLVQTTLSDSEDSDRDTTGSSYASSSICGRHFPKNATSSKRIIHGDQKALFYYVNLRAKEAICVHPIEIFQDDDYKDDGDEDASRIRRSIVSNFESSMKKIHDVLAQKKTSGTNRFQRSGMTVKECGVLYECSSAVEEKEKRMTSYWTVGRNLSKEHLGETYVCYDDKTPQNMVEVAFRLASA